jgi:hypothetical protein
LTPQAQLLFALMMAYWRLWLDLNEIHNDAINASVRAA